MSELLNSGQVGVTVFKNLQEQRKAIVENWRATGLLEELKSPGEKINVALILESQAQQLLNDYSQDDMTTLEKSRYHHRRAIEEMDKGNSVGAEFQLIICLNTLKSHIKDKHL